MQTIPTSFTHTVLLNEPKDHFEVLLKHAGGTWKVFFDLYRRPNGDLYSSKIGNGFMKFLTDNNVNVNDVLTFELVDVDDTDAMTFEIKVFN